MPATTTGQTRNSTARADPARVTTGALSEVLTAALRAAGARGIEARPAVHYARKRVRVVMTGGPSADVVRDALQPLLTAGRLLSVSVIRQERWTCGAVHESAAHAWAAHEGSRHLREVAVVSGGCCHDGDEIVIRFDDLAELLAAGETFRSEVCEPAPFTPAPKRRHRQKDIE